MAKNPDFPVRAGVDVAIRIDGADRYNLLQRIALRVAPFDGGIPEEPGLLTDRVYFWHGFVIPESPAAVAEILTHLPPPYEMRPIEGDTMVEHRHRHHRVVIEAWRARQIGGIGLGMHWSKQHDLKIADEGIHLPRH